MYLNEQNSSILVHTILHRPMQISINLIINEPQSFEIFIFSVYFHRIDYFHRIESI